MSNLTTRSLLLTLAFFLIPLPAFAQGGPPADSSGHAVADTARQRAWQQFQQKHGAQWKIRWSDRTPVGRQPAQAGARKAPTTVFGAVTKPYAGPPKQAARAFLKEHRTLFRMPPDLSNLEKRSARTFRGVTHVRFRQTYEGIPVYEGEYLVHVREDGRIDMANGNYYAAIEAPTTPSVSEQAAAQFQQEHGADWQISWHKNAGTPATLLGGTARCREAMRGTEWTFLPGVWE